MRTTRLFWLLLAAIAAPTVQAAGSAEAGAAKAATCMACHGVNGNSTNPVWPRLAGQNAAYLTTQLKAWHEGRRIDATNLMPAMGATLSDQDMQDVALYYSQQVPDGLEADPSYWRAGERLYRGGDRGRQIPACMACHGPVGRGNPAAGYPALRAQQSVYLSSQLTNYAAGKRYTMGAKGQSSGGANALIMQDIAKRLAPEDIRNVSSYIQGMR